METVVKWSQYGSLHGITHTLNAEKRFSHRMLWAIVVMTFMFICSYLQISFLYTYLVVQPTVVDLMYEREESLNFPNVVICDLNQEDDQWNAVLDVPGRKTGPLSRLLTQMSKNEMFESMRWEFRHNVTQTILKYPRVTQYYDEYYARANPEYAYSINYLETLDETLKQYLDPDFSDTGMSAVNFDLLSRSASSSLTELIKFCQWNGEDCRHEGDWDFVKTLNVMCLEFTPKDRVVRDQNQKLRLIFDAEIDQGVPFLDVGGGLALQIFFYDPTHSVLTTLDKKYSFNIGPGWSYKAGLSLNKIHDTSGFSDCIEEGTLG
ncbi:uncharacterized protein LOC142358211, partial [Convolutriloba macropyga]